MAKSKTKRRAKRTSKRRARAAPRAAAREAAKFYGTMRMSAPDPSGPPLVDGADVVVSIAELWVKRWPERGRRAEAQLDVRVATTDVEGEALVTGWSSGLHYYVPHGARFHLEEAVVWAGPVHRHLSFDFELTELEMPQASPDDAAELARAAAEAAVALSGASGGLAAALGAFPTVLGAIFRLNGDDQVLKYATSLFPRGADRSRGPNDLVAGRYDVEKLDDKQQPWVRLTLAVREAVRRAG